jgi:hypothetical protein
LLWHQSMAKEPHQKTYAELAQDMCTRADSLVQLTAKVEMARRAAIYDQWRSWVMLDAQRTSPI